MTRVLIADYALCYAHGAVIRSHAPSQSYPNPPLRFGVYNSDGLKSPMVRRKFPFRSSLYATVLYCPQRVETLGEAVGACDVLT